MIHATLDETAGTLIVAGERISKHYPYSDFNQRFGQVVNLIYGQGATASYSLREPIVLFKEEFRLCVQFNEGKLDNFTLLLISGPVHIRTTEYPDQAELQKEMDFLALLYSSHLHGQYTREFAWRHSWKYNWGEITLMMQSQNSSVITDLSWTP